MSNIKFVFYASGIYGIRMFTSIGSIEVVENCLGKFKKKIFIVPAQVGFTQSSSLNCNCHSVVSVVCLVIFVVSNVGELRSVRCYKRGDLLQVEV